MYIYIYIYIYIYMIIWTVAEATSLPFSAINRCTQAGCRLELLGNPVDC